MKFLRVVRFDDSDDQVFSRAARAGEWAVTGSFVFTFDDQDPGTLTGKPRQAFRNGFLGTESFGWSTLVTVAEIDEAGYEAVVDRIAQYFVDHYGAPNAFLARPNASVEVEYAASLCDHPVNTILAVERETQGRDIRENFRIVRPQARWEDDNVRVWSLIPED